MKTLSQLQNEAIERFEERFEIETDIWGGGTAIELDPEIKLSSLKDFLKTELETIVKESFKNTETVGEDHKLEITKQGEIDTSKTHWATYGYRAALSDTKIKQNQFLNN